MNPLVQQLLAQMTSQQGAMLSPLAPLGKIALAAALRSQMKQAEQKQQAQQQQLVDVIQPDAPTTLNQVFGQQSSQNQRYWGKTKPLADVVEAKRAALGTLDAETLQGALAKQLFPEQKPTDYQISQTIDKDGNTVLVRSPKTPGVGGPELIWQGGRKPESTKVSQTVNVAEDAFGRGIGAGAAKSFGVEYESARDAASSVPAYRRASELLSSGNVISGSGANQLLGLKRLGATLGFTGGQDVADTEEYLGLTGKFVAQQIQAFGAGTGLSDADREFARQIAGGEISVTTEGLKRLIKMGDRAATGKINTYNDRRKKLGESERRVIDYYPEITLPSGNDSEDTSASGEEWTLPSGAKVRRK